MMGDPANRGLSRETPSVGEVVPLPYQSLNAAGEIITVNDTWLEVLGYDRDAVVGRHFSTLLPGRTRHEFEERFDEHVAQGGVKNAEFQMRHADGHSVTVLFSGTVETDEEGSFVRTHCQFHDITERKEQEQELRTTKERMKMALEGANLGIWDWDMETDEVVRDELLTEMLGYTPSEMGDHLDDWERVVHPEGKARHNEALAEHIENRTPYYQCEYRLETKSGDWKWVRTMGKVVQRDETGEPLRAVGIHQDIDDRKRAELTLENERDMFKQGPAVVFEWEDASGWPITYVSKNVEDVLGYTPEQLQSGEFVYADLVHDEDFGRVEQEMAEYNKEGSDRFSPEPYRVTTAEGDVRWVIEYTKDLQEDGDDNHLLGYLVDITERKRRERELEARETKYRNLFEDTRDALMLLDRDGFFDCNEQTLELFGIESVDAFVDYTPWDLSPSTQPDGRDSETAALDHVETAFEEGEAFFEWTHQRADGTDFPAEVKLSRFEHQGEPALHALVRDITERKEYEQRLEEQRDNLDILNQVLRHDIRNDIQLIMAYAELFETESDDEELQEYTETVIDTADHVVELTTSAREMANVMLSAEEELQRVGLRAVLETELQEVQSAYPEVELTRETTIPPVSVQANDMLDSVFRNLLKNAIQHNDKDVPEVAVSAIDHDDTVVVRVADNGPGVPDAQKDTIFGKGERGLDSQGTGIGLYLVKTLVESYGGDIRVEDRKDNRLADSRSQTGVRGDHSPPDGRSETDDRTEQSAPDSHPNTGDECEGAVFVVELPKEEME